MHSEGSDKERALVKSREIKNVLCGWDSMILLVPGFSLRRLHLQYELVMKDVK